MIHQIKVKETIRISYPWRDMEPGDEFAVPAELFGGDRTAAQNQVCNAMRVQHERRPERYKTKAVKGGVIVKRFT